MIQPREPAHILTELTTCTTPKRLLWLDCASSGVKQHGAYIEKWRAGALGRTWYTAKRGERRDTIDTYNTPEGLWTSANQFCTARKRVVLWAYDLAHQLRISQGLVMLPGLGWRLDRIVLERSAAWALFRDGKRTLMMVDLKSWAPVEFSKLASDVYGGPWDDRETLAGPNLHAERCRARINVVRGAAMQVLEWLKTENLGPFRPTGSGQSYAGYRKRFMDTKLLVHDDTERLHAERVAMWTGRCEAWKHGKLTNGPYVEYDMNAAYCRIAAECGIPVRAVGETNTRNVTKLLALAEKRALLCHITVDTDMPVLPTSMNGRTVWPVGTFSTWVWEPELKIAASYANNVKVHRVYTYDRAPALRDFARFVLRGLEPQTSIYGGVPDRVLKHWSRCLVGRFGLRFRAWVPFGTSPTQDLRLVTYIDTDEGTSTDMLMAGRDRLILSDMSESVDSMPQIPSWVMSECRRRMWDMIIAAGVHTVVYMDTDSVIVTRDRTLFHETLLGQHIGDAWSTKGTYDSLTINGPRNYSTNKTRHMSGLPLSARQVAPLEFSGQVMRSIKESMRNGELDCVASMPRRFVMDAPDMRRIHLDHNQTAPIRVQLPQEDY